MTREPSAAVPWRELRKRTQPRRGLALREAALYVGVHARKFARAVTMHEAPQPKLILGQTVWDMAELDDYIDRQPTRDQKRKGPAKGYSPRL